MCVTRLTSNFLDEFCALNARFADGWASRDGASWQPSKAQEQLVGLTEKRRSVREGLSQDRLKSPGQLPRKPAVKRLFVRQDRGRLARRYRQHKEESELYQVFGFVDLKAEI